MNLPNKLTVLRIFMIPLFVVLFYLQILPYNFIIAGVVFALACFTDYLDGHIARKYNLVTDFGKFLDPIADKILVSTALIISLVPPTNVIMASLDGLTWINAVIIALILARELLISGFRLIAAGKSKVIAADKSGKLKTFFTDITIILMLISAQFTTNANQVLNIIAFVCLAISGVLTVYSGAECIIKNIDVLKENK